MCRLVKIILIISYVSKIDAAKILAIFPTPSISHQVVFRPLTQELARLGHEITVITADPAFTKENAPANLTEIDFHDISYKTWKQTFMNNKLQLGKRSSMVELTKTLIEMMFKMTEEQMKTKEMQELFNDGNKKFDLIILESCARPYNIFSHIFKAPVIEISSFGMFFGSEEIVGAPSHPFLYPTESNQKLFNLTFWEKVYELYTHVRINRLWSAALDEEMSLFRKLLGNDNIPGHEELNKNTEFMFLNIHPVWSHNQPLPPNVISIWGIHKTPEKPLPKDLENYLNSSKNGVVYVSFGSNVRSSLLPPRTVETLMGVFSKLPYDVLLKWDNINVPGLSSNVKVSTWLPQSDLLRTWTKQYIVELIYKYLVYIFALLAHHGIMHEIEYSESNLRIIRKLEHSKIKLFITQGGLQSTDEAINAGVPLVGIPMFGDQWYNVELYEYHKIGLRVDMENLTDDNLLKAIKAVIDDKSYRKNIIRLCNIMRDQPESALDRAVWWTEYVLRHGGAKHLRAAAANMPWTQYYEIEFILTLGSIILIFAAAFLVISYFLLRKFIPNIKEIP